MCRIQPTLLVRGEADRRVPVDARVFLRFPGAPESFLGLQLPVAIHEVQGTKYPYLYTVIVARESFGLLDRHLPAVRACAPPEITVERSREEDVEVIVIRRRTTKKTGYHTNGRAVTLIARTAWRAVRAILEARAAGRVES